MSDDIITVWVTKYALTQGIFTIRAKICKGKYASQADRTPGCGYFLAPSEYALSQADAIKQASARRDKAIRAAAKKLAKLQTMVFEAANEQPD